MKHFKVVNPSITAAFSRISLVYYKPVIPVSRLQLVHIEGLAQNIPYPSRRRDPVHELHHVV